MTLVGDTTKRQFTFNQLFNAKCTMNLSCKLIFSEKSKETVIILKLIQSMNGHNKEQFCCHNRPP